MPFGAWKFQTQRVPGLLRTRCSPPGRSVSVRSGRQAEEGPGVHTLCRVATASAAPTALEALRPGSTRALGQRVCGGGGSQAASLTARSTEGDLTHYGHGLFRRAGMAALGQRPPRQPAQSARRDLLLQGGAGREREEQRPHLRPRLGQQPAEPPSGSGRCGAMMRKGSK